MSQYAAHVGSGILIDIKQIFMECHIYTQIRKNTKHPDLLSTAFNKDPNLIAASIKFIIPSNLFNEILHRYLYNIQLVFKCTSCVITICIVP